MQFRAVLTVAATIALALVSITDATDTISMKTLPVGRALADNLLKPDKTLPVGRTLADHSPMPERTLPVGRGHEKASMLPLEGVLAGGDGQALAEHASHPERTLPVGGIGHRLRRGSIA